MHFDKIHFIYDLNSIILISSLTSFFFFSKGTLKAHQDINFHFFFEGQKERIVQLIYFKEKKNVHGA